MYHLSNKEKLDFIKKKSKELGISSYEYGQNTSLSDLGARNILDGTSKNPRTKNLNIMLKYLEDKVIGTNLSSKAEEPQATYQETIEDIIFNRVEKRFQNKINLMEGKIKLLRKDLKRIHDQIISLRNESTNKNSKSS